MSGHEQGHACAAVRRAGPPTLAISDAGVHAVLELKVEDVHRRAVATLGSYAHAWRQRAFPNKER